MADKSNIDNSYYLPQQESYIKYQGVWDIIDDCLEGEDEVKSMGTKYLHKTTGMEMDSTYGDKMYNSYRYKAQWYDFPSTFLENLDGLLWQKDPVIDVPTDMEKEFIPSPSFYSNKSFLDVYRETALQVITYSRHAILLDPPQVRKSVVYPHIVQYNTRQIKHWGFVDYKGQSVLQYVLLDESSSSFDNEHLAKKTVHKYRFLGLKTHDNGVELDEPMYYSYIGTDDFVAIFDPPLPDSDGSVDVDGVLVTYPSIHGKYADRIPFFCFGATEMTLDPSKPILYPLCKACLALYRSSADYEEYLFKQSFAMLFGKGFKTEDIFVGTHKAITTESPDADLKYVEISGSGLSAHKQALEDKYNYALTIGYGLLTGESSRTGKTVQNTVSVKAASLKSISKTLATGFIEICKFAAKWRGLSDKDVNAINILPNMEFTVNADTAKVLNDYTIWKQGGLTNFDYYCSLRENGMTTYTSFDSWMSDIKKTNKELEKLFEYQNKPKQMTGKSDKEDVVKELENSTKTDQKEGLDKPKGQGGDSIPDVQK